MAQYPQNGRNDIIRPGIVAEAVLVLWAWWFDRHREMAAGLESEAARP